MSELLTGVGGMVLLVALLFLVVFWVLFPFFICHQLSYIQKQVARLATFAEQMAKNAARIERHAESLSLAHPIGTTCSFCSQRIEYPAAMRDTHMECPGCGEKIRLP